MNADVSSSLAGAGAAFLACIALLAVYETARAIAAWRRRHPARASTPAPGTSPGAGAASPLPHCDAPDIPPGQAPAPGHNIDGPIDVRLLGRCVATANFYDSGATVTYDHRTQRRYIDLPEPGDDAIEDFLREAAP